MQHRPQLFYTTEPAPCPYLPNRLERKVLTDLSGENASALHDRLSQAGFRRSHFMAYAPVCVGCRACVPLRIPVATFLPTRTQRKAQKRLQKLHIQILAPVTTDEQFALFERYQHVRHANGDMALMKRADYDALISNTPVQTSVIEFRTEDGSLVCVSLVDRLGDGLSAVYTFYDPTDPAASWGSCSILWLIQETARQGLGFLYMGYYVPGSRKMDYKALYQPAETLHDGHWYPFSKAP